MLKAVFLTFHVLVISFGIVTGCWTSRDSLVARSSSDNSYDLLMFVQMWPITKCIERTSSDCGLDINGEASKKAWTVHGIWPTRYGHVAPVKCRKVPYDPDQLSPTMMSELKERWKSVTRSGAVFIVVKKFELFKEFKFKLKLCQWKSTNFQLK